METKDVQKDRQTKDVQKDRQTREDRTNVHKEDQTSVHKEDQPEDVQLVDLTKKDQIVDQIKEDLLNVDQIKEDLLNVDQIKKDQIKEDLLKEDQINVDLTKEDQTKEDLLNVDQPEDLKDLLNVDLPQEEDNPHMIDLDVQEDPMMIPFSPWHHLNPSLFNNNLLTNSFPDSVQILMTSLVDWVISSVETTMLVPILKIWLVLL
jgi:hypothetical protein